MAAKSKNKPKTEGRVGVTAEDAEGLHVVAIGVGYHDSRLRHPGDKFYLSDPGHFSERWMRKLDKDSNPIEPEGDEGEED